MISDEGGADKDQDGSTDRLLKNGTNAGQSRNSLNKPNLLSMEADMFKAKRGGRESGNMLTEDSPKREVQGSGTIIPHPMGTTELKLSIT